MEINSDHCAINSVGDFHEDIFEKYRTGLLYATPSDVFLIYLVACFLSSEDVGEPTDTCWKILEIYLTWLQSEIIIWDGPKSFKFTNFKNVRVGVNIYNGIKPVVYWRVNI